MNTMTLTCHQQGCSNQDIPITLEIFDDPEFPPPRTGVCGGCMQPITDITYDPPLPAVSAQKEKT